MIHLPNIHKPFTVLLHNIVSKFLTYFVISDTLTLYSNKMFDIDNYKPLTVLLNNIVSNFLTDFVISDRFTLYSQTINFGVKQYCIKKKYRICYQ